LKNKRHQHVPVVPRFYLLPLSIPLDSEEARLVALDRIPDLAPMDSLSSFTLNMRDSSCTGEEGYRPTTLSFFRPLCSAPSVVSVNHGMYSNLSLAGVGDGSGGNFNLIGIMTLHDHVAVCYMIGCRVASSDVHVVAHDENPLECVTLNIENVIPWTLV
jgi:hypothetical protein